MALIIPNSIDNGTAVDAVEHQQNYAAIATWANTESVMRDGSVAMTGQLLLNANPTVALGAATKSYADTVGNGKLALTGGTLTGGLTGTTLTLSGALSCTTITASGMVTLPTTTPTTVNHATRKAYVDAQDALQLSLTGGTVTGATTFNSNVSIGGSLRSDGTLAFQTVAGTSTGLIRGVTPRVDTTASARNLTTTRQNLNLDVTTFTAQRTGFVWLQGIFEFVTVSAGNETAKVECAYSVNGGALQYFPQVARFSGSYGFEGVDRATVSQQWYLAVTAGSTYAFSCWGTATAASDYQIQSAHSNLMCLQFT